MIKIFLYILTIFIFTGCMSTTNKKVVYTKYTPPSIVTNDYTLQTKISLPASGSIKGKVEEVFYDGKNWIIFIKSKDTTNGKLSQVKFSSAKRIAKKGDEIYAIIKKGKLIEYFLTKKANFKQEKIQKHKTVAYKRTKKRQLLGVPSSESISLD